MNQITVVVKMNTVIYLLPFTLFIVSANGRIAVSKDEKTINNVILDEKKTSDKEIHIDLPVFTSEIKNTTEVPNIIQTTIKALSKCDPNSNSSEITDNTIDSNEVPCVPEERIDNGTALILTPYIKENRTTDARNASRVPSEIFFGIESYSGYLTVNETYDSNIFFWYFPVEKKPVNETPWIIWLQGGPGASSMTGLFDEIGPFFVDPNGVLRRNPYTWLRNHSLIFIENPVGTGFSFTNYQEGYVTDMETYSSHLYIALRQFLQIFPELKRAPLFVAGESYAGKYVPALSAQIHQHRCEADGDINLQGLIVGNGYVEPEMVSKMIMPFYYFGLLQKEQVDMVKPLIAAFESDVAAHNSTAAKTRWNHLITALLILTHQKHIYNFLRDEMPIGRYSNFLTKSEVKRALHVGDIKYTFVNMTVNMKLNGDFLSSAKPLYEELLDHYRVLVYCGQLDQMLPCVLTSENYRTWNWNGSKEFVEATRYPYLFHNRLAGYHKTGGHLTEVVIRGAGHMAPQDAPAPLQNLVTLWTHSEPLSNRSVIFTTNILKEYISNHSSINYL